MKLSWLEISDRIKFELKQREEEGSDVHSLLNEWKQIKASGLSEVDFEIQSNLFYRKISKTPYHTKNEIEEPVLWDDIVDKCKIESDNIPSFSSKFIEDRILGGWMGRSAGCLLGKPVEKTSRSGIKELLSSNNTWPIKDYITEIGIPNSLLEKYPWNRHSGEESLKENIKCMPEDDDMNYSMVNLTVYERYGREFTTENILQVWMELIPILSTFTAERVAYVNALNGLLPPETALVRNPYREWIGAQIRADLWGWISPAQPSRAARFAWRDARLTHTRNGMYGEIFFAAVIALCFKYNDIINIINEALSFVPPESRFAEAIRFVLSIPVQKQPWEDTVDLLYKQFGSYYWVHTINNAALVTAALLSSNGDYGKGICNVVMGGWDTDSNGATVGSILGTMLGVEKLPSKWISPLNDKIRSSLKGFDNYRLSDLSKRTLKIANFKNKK